MVMGFGTKAYSQTDDIFQAIQNNDLTAVKSILKEDTKCLKKLDEEKNTPLHLASELGYLEIVKLLVNKGAVVNFKNLSERTPLHFAASKNHFPVVKLLVTNGADLNINSPYDGIPANSAIGFKSDSKLIKFLINNGTDLSNEDVVIELISTACMSTKYPEIVDLLLDKGFQIPANQNKQIKLVSKAVSCDNVRLLNMVLEKNPDALKGRENVLVSHAVQQGAIQVFKLFAEKKFNLDVTNRYGSSLIHLMAKNGNLAMLKILLENGIDVDSKNSIGKTALHIAKDVEHQETVEFLIQNGASQKPYVFPALEGAYLGQKLPGSIPEMFATGIVSIEGNEHSPPVFSKDGTEVFWVSEFPQRIYGMVFKDNRWSEPYKAHFNYGNVKEGTEPDFASSEPVFSNDNNRLFFLSNRNKEMNGKYKTSGIGKIWYVDRLENGWSKAKYLNGGENLGNMTATWTISVDDEESIYMGTQYTSSGYGKLDIYKSKLINGTYQKPQSLGPVINTKLNEQMPFMAPDRSYLIYSIKNHPQGKGRDDLFISFKKQNGEWSTPQNLGGDINTRGSELSPVISPDGKYMFFLRIGPGDIFWVNTSFIEELRIN